MANTPNPERVYAAIAAILGRRYNVAIEYILRRKEDTNEQEKTSGRQD